MDNKLHQKTVTPPIGKPYPKLVSTLARAQLEAQRLGIGNIRRILADLIHRLALHKIPQIPFLPIAQIVSSDFEIEDSEPRNAAALVGISPRMRDDRRFADGVLHRIVQVAMDPEFGSPRQDPVVQIGAKPSGNRRASKSGMIAQEAARGG